MALHVSHVAAPVVLKLATMGLDPSACARGGCSLLPGQHLVWLCVSHCPQPAVRGAVAGDAYPRLGKRCHQCPAQVGRTERSP